MAQNEIGELKPPEFGGGGKIEERLRPLEWVATVSAAALFLAIVGFLTAGMMQLYGVSAPPLVGVVADQSQAIANFKSLNDIQSERVFKGLDLSITKTLLPVFTTLIGYLLGKRQ